MEVSTMFLKKETMRRSTRSAALLSWNLIGQVANHLMIVMACWALGMGTARADYTFGTPTNLGPTVNSSVWDNGPIVSADGLSLFFDGPRPGGYGGFDIWVTTRETVQEPWAQPVNLGPSINTAADESPGDISPDGLTFYFTSNRSSGLGSYDTWVTTRATIQDPWGEPVNLGSTINSSAGDLGGRISADGLEFYFISNRPGGSGGYDIWVTTRATIQNPWGNPVDLGSGVNSPVWDYSPAPSPDGLRLFFSSNRPSQHGVWAIWVAERATRDGDWGAPVNLGPAINSSFDQENPYLSADGSTLYFASTRPGGSGDSDLWQVSIEPVVDFTGDSRVDLEDLLILTENWAQDAPSVDMAPMPWGDGIVDAQDLEVLMSYWGQDATFVAHWKLDETGGDIAYDSVNDNHAAVMGDPTWQRESGQIDGALQLDGIDDYLAAPFILDPTKQPFSIFAWIKGGQPGQSIISQKGGFGAWLSVDSAGALSTGLTFPLPPVTSNVVITDDLWHRIGLVSDGAGMSLYVDDVEVARTPTSPILPANGDLQIGAGKNLEPGVFWEGLIDDVRIYDRVVIP
jgi:hypothetical protein